MMEATQARVLSDKEMPILSLIKDQVVITDRRSDNSTTESSASDNHLLNTEIQSGNYQKFSSPLASSLVGQDDCMFIYDNTVYNNRMTDLGSCFYKVQRTQVEVYA